MKTTEYKNSEVGRIPADWTVKQIGKMGYTYSGLTGKNKEDFGKGEARYITFLNVLNNPILKTDIFETVDVKEGELQNKAIKGDLFFNTSSETPEEVGICALLNEDISNLYLNSFCFGYRLIDTDIDGLYLSYYFRSKQGRDIMSALAQGATRYNLSKEYFNKTLIAFPTIDEQKKVAKALSEIDSLLCKQNEEIEKKRMIKDGLMQELLTGKKRLAKFNGEWKQITLGEYCSIVMGQSPSSTFYNQNGVGLPLIQGNSDFENRKSIIRTYTSYITKTCNQNDTIMSVRAPVGAVGKASSDSCLGRGVCAFRTDTDFLFYYMQYNEDKWGQFSKGSTFDSVNRDDLCAVIISVPPSKKEESAICDILSSFDKDIEQAISQRDKYLHIKQGMMQQLLTGKTRL